jgi:hypothetical protein
MAVEAVLDHEQSTSPGTPTTGGLKFKGGMGLDDSVIANSSALMEHRKRVSDGISTMETAG